MTRPPEGDPLLVVRDLRVGTGHHEIIHGLNMTIGRGERVGLIGESGSGKSLTCLSVMGLLAPNLVASGSARLTGVEGDLLETSEKDLALLRGSRMSMVFQEPMTALNPLVQIGRQVAEVMTIGGRGVTGVDAHVRAVELLDSVGIPDPGRAALAYPHQLSGGQRQRVMLAMAMANQPDLLFADEPTTALDVTIQSQVLQLMRRQVQQAGSSLLFITHDLAIVAETCERVIIMRDGSVVEHGPLDEVFSAAKSAYTRALLAASSLETNPRTGRLLTIVDTDSPIGTGGLGRDAPRPVAASQPAAVEPPHDALSDDHAGSLVFNRARPGLSLPSLVSATEIVRSYVRSGIGLGAPRMVHAVRNVSFDVLAGQHFGIVGESGCGKSTLLRILTGLDTTTSGSVRIDGQEITGVKERRLRWLRKKVQIVFQDPMGSLDPRMRIGDIIAEPLRGVGSEERRAKVARLIDDVGLPRTAIDLYPHEFSGGQRQRIAIARALVCSPSILMADEAVSALDVSVRAQVLNLLSDLVDEYGLTLVFVSHDLHVVRHVCDVVAVMQKGQIVECGATEAVYQDALHPYTRSLIAAMPTLQVA